MNSDGNGMSFISQPPPTSDDVIPIMVIALKGSNNTYYAVIGDTFSSKQNVYDVTTRSSPQKRGNLTKSVYRYAKNSDSTVIGIATVDGKFEIYTTDAFVNNGHPPDNTFGPGGGGAGGLAH